MSLETSSLLLRADEGDSLLLASGEFLIEDIHRAILITVETQATFRMRAAIRSFVE